MKKIISIVLVLMMVSSVLVGCGNNDQYILSGFNNTKKPKHIQNIYSEEPLGTGNGANIKDANIIKSKLLELETKYPSGTNQSAVFDTNGLVHGNYDHGYQCFGYADTLFFELWGICMSQAEVSKDVDSLCVGDAVRFNTTPVWDHSILITDIIGDQVYYTDCNAEGTCFVYWRKQVSKRDLQIWIDMPLKDSEYSPGSYNRGQGYGYIDHCLGNSIKTLTGSDSTNDGKNSTSGTTSSMSKSEESKTSELKGIITIKSETDSIVVYSINPATGDVSTVRKFNIPSDKYSGPIIDVDLLTVRQSFDADLKRVAVQTQKLSDGSTHVGWIDESGMFTDVTEKVTNSSGDFSSAVYHVKPRFGSNNDFYYCIPNIETMFTNVIREVYKVSLNDLQKEVVQSVLISEYSGMETGYYVQPNGSTTTSTGERFINASMLFCSSWDSIYDWVGSNAYVGPDGDYGQIYLIKQDFSLPLLPGNKTRKNFNAVASPDGKQIAFLSHQQTGTEPVDLFIVSTNGGEPIKIKTNYIFNRAYRRSTKLDWSTQLFIWK